MNQFLSFLARVNEEADLGEMARGDTTILHELEERL